MRIEVLHVRPVRNQGNLRALANVSVGRLEIVGVRIIQQPGQRPYVAMPQVQDEGGRWRPVLKCADEGLKDRFRQEVLAAWKEAA